MPHISKSRLKKPVGALLAACTLSLLAATARAQYFSVQTVPLVTNHVVYDSFNQKIYATVPGSAASNPNTVARVDAATGAVEAYLPTGSEPDALALSSDGQYLYVGIDGASAVARINLTTNAVDQQFSLGTSPLSPQYPYHAGSIIPLPGQPQSVAVTRNYFGLSPSNDGIVVYDNGVMRTNILLRGYNIYDSVVASGSPARLYSYDNESTGYTFAQINVDANGLTVGQTSDSFGTSILSGFTTRIKFDIDNGLVYATNGKVIDPQALTDVGTFPGLTDFDLFTAGGSADVIPSGSENRVYFLIGEKDSFGSRPVSLRTYNQTTFQQISSFTTPSNYFNIGDLSEISPSAFVFRSNQGVELLRAAAVTSVSLTPTQVSLAVGTTQGLTLTGAIADGTTADLTTQAAWTSSAPTVAAVSAAGVVTAITPGTARITAAYGGQTATGTVTVLDPHNALGATHVLWDNTNGAASIWNYLPADGSLLEHTYGPYPGWTAAAIAGAGPNGMLRVLWNNAGGAASIWNLDNATGSFTQHTYGPYPGWTARRLSVSPDDTTHLLWTNTDGRAALWNYQTSDGSFTQHMYGPYPGWSAKAVAEGSNGQVRLLWNNTGGQAALWSVDSASGSFQQYTYGPYAGWTATALSVSADGTAHLLWNNSDGRASIWNQTQDGFGSFTQHTFGPYAGYAAQGVADGPDGQVRVLWDRAGGAASLWSLDSFAGAFNQFSFGPYSGWTAVGVSVGR